MKTIAASANKVKVPRNAKHTPKPASRALEIYAHLREEVFEFRLFPGVRFTETELAERYGTSRTPVREALLRLQTEGLIRGYFRNGWEVVPIDFARFDHLYELRKLIEIFAVRRLSMSERSAKQQQSIDQLAAVWLKEKAKRLSNARRVAELDENFHTALVAANGNPEMARVHAEITDRIRIIRRLDFTYENRIHATYDEHAAIVRAIQRHKADQAELLMRAHIEQSQVEIRKIALHRLHSLQAERV